MNFLPNRPGKMDLNILLPYFFKLQRRSSHMPSNSSGFSKEVRWRSQLIGNTAENLKAAAEGENEEWTDLYPTFAEIAKEEGFPKVASIFKLIATVEAEHEKRYLKLLQNVTEDKVFMKDGKVWWKCMVCGYVYESRKAMENCPACHHPKAYMKLKEEDY